MNLLSKRIAQGLVFVLGAIPFAVRSQLGWLVGYIFGCFPSRERRIASLQLRVFLDKEVSPLLIRRVFANAGRTFFESFNLRPVLTDPRYSIVLEDTETFKKLRTADRPIVALTAHTGNWDLLGAYIIHQGMEVTTIARDARSPFAQSILSCIRDRYGIGTLWRSDKKGMKQLIQVLKDRNIVAALIDQDTRVSSSHIPFFSHPAKTPSSLVTLGKRHNAQFVSAFLFRTGGTSYQLYLAPLDSAKETDDILTAYNMELERLVRQFPEQWVWFHKRWRSLPTGAVLSSSEYIDYLERKLST
jgi:KDO2-lipid IV(A) lauroyltransferase